MIDIVTYRWHIPWEYIATRKHHRPGILYGPEYVEKLHRGIDRHLSIPHRFHHFEEGDFMDPFPGWFQLLSFMKLPFPFLFVSLDTVFTGSIDEYVEMGQKNDCFTINKDIAGTDLPNTNIAWVQDCQYLYEKFKAIYGDGTGFYNDRSEYGKQPVWTEERFIQEHGTYKWFPDEWRISYKLHLRDNKHKKIPKECKFINFHGLPKPHEVMDDPRIAKHWI